MSDEKALAEGAAAEGTGRRVNRFWTLDSTEAALRELDIFASVAWARRLGSVTIPTVDAIFEKPVAALPRFQLTEGGPWQVDWESYRRDQTDRLKSAEELVYLGVMLVLRRADMLDFVARVLRYFPRTGPYGPARDGREHRQTSKLGATAVFDPAAVSYADKQVVWAVVSEIAAASRQRLTDEEKARKAAEVEERRRRRRMARGEGDPGYGRATDRELGSAQWPNKWPIGHRSRQRIASAAETE